MGFGPQNVVRKMVPYQATGNEFSNYPKLVLYRLLVAVVILSASPGYNDKRPKPESIAINSINACLSPTMRSVNLAQEVTTQKVLLFVLLGKLPF